jgi:hypothetical protein
MSWALDNSRPVTCPCGRALSSPKGLENHLRKCHPTLSDRERSEVVGASRKILGR